MLQEPVHVDVGQQWTCDAALRRGARVSFAAVGIGNDLSMDVSPHPVKLRFLSPR
jgi:hypothetical protein